MIEKQFCSQVTTDELEASIGTAPRVDTWLLLECRGTWGTMALEDGALPDPTKEWLSHISRTFSNLRPQLIRQIARRVSDKITCFLAVSREGRQALYKFQLDSYEDLPSLDIAALIAGESRYNDHLCNEPLFLVCTHGKHDLCCAKFGMPIYKKLTELVGEHVWQSSHVGGDKFAANVVCLPRGIYYGRVSIADVQMIVESCSNNQLFLEKYRGTTCYPPIVQAADYFLRQQSHIHAFDAFKLRSVQAKTSKTYCVTFDHPATGTNHQLTVTGEIKEVITHSSCKGTSCSLSYTYQLDTYSTREPAIAEASALREQS